jgi:hypothetical protein
MEEIMKNETQPEPDYCAGLSHKHRTFVREYLQHHDMYEAYRKAYPRISERSLGSAARRLFNFSFIQERIERAEMRKQREAEKLFAERLGEQLTAYTGIREACAEIISGKMKFDKTYKAEDDLKHEHVGAGAAQVVQALNLCFKIAKEIPGSSGIPRPRLMIGGVPFK